MKDNNKGFILLESLAAISISIIIISCGLLILYICLKDWYIAENKMELNYNCCDSINKLVEEIRDSYGVEILDEQNGWIKIYNNSDRTQFTSYRIKNKKLFVGYSNVLNSNSEFANYLKEFKVKYIPQGVEDFSQAKGVNIFMKFEKNNFNFDISTSAAFRCN